MQLHCLNNEFDSIHAWPRTSLVLEASCSSSCKALSLWDRIRLDRAQIQAFEDPVDISSTVIEPDPSEGSAIIEDKKKRLAHRESILVFRFKNPSRILGTFIQTSESTGCEWDKYLHRILSYRIAPSLKPSTLQFVANEFQARTFCFGLLRHRLHSISSLDLDPERGVPHINKPVSPLHSVRSRRLLPWIERLELWPCVSVLFYLQHCPDKCSRLRCPTRFHSLCRWRKWERCTNV